MNLGGSKTFTFDFGFLLGLNCVLDEVKIGKLWQGGAGVGVGDVCVSEADGGVAAGGGGGVVGDLGGWLFSTWGQGISFMTNNFFSSGLTPIVHSCLLCLK